MNTVIHGMYGLGDNIYQRPFIRAQAAREPTWLMTSWPELYSDIPGLRFVKPVTTLRTQLKNINRFSAHAWSSPTIFEESRTIQLRYTARDLRAGSIIDALERALPLHGAAYRFDLPHYGEDNMFGPRPYAVVRPCTLRKEWHAPSRNPKPEYIQAAIDVLNDWGLNVVTVADCDGEAEWFDGPEPVHQYARFHEGQLGTVQLMNLIQHASICVGGVGWITPMSIAAGVPSITIYGGRGGHNWITKITDQRMNLGKWSYIVPDDMCMCEFAVHDCDKTITDFQEQFEAHVAEHLA